MSFLTSDILNADDLMSDISEYYAILDNRDDEIYSITNTQVCDLHSGELELRERYTFIDISRCDIDRESLEPCDSQEPFND